MKRPFLLALLCTALAASAAPTRISLTLGPHAFAWEIEGARDQGTFVDGQPWVVVDPGARLIAVSPARENGVQVEEQQGRPFVADINLTVVNPPVGTFYNEHGRLEDLHAFGWDSRGAIRYGVGRKFNPDLAWDGETPLPLRPGDVLTTALSRRTDVSATALEALAVLTVLAEAPPADAFRPGVIRSEARKTEIEWFRLSDIVIPDTALIPLPSSDLFGNAPRLPETFRAAHLTSLLPGPGFMNQGLNDSQGTNALWNNAGADYAADVSMQAGDLAVGSLASWLTPEERQLCRIRFLQRAIDLYEAVLAGLCLSHDGGMMSGHGTHIVLAAAMLQHEGMRSFDREVNGMHPMYYFSEYAQTFFLTNGQATSTPRAEPADGPRSLRPDHPDIGLNLDKLPVASAGPGTLTLPPDFVWPVYRAARGAINLKLEITEGPGAGNQVYVVTGFRDFHDARGGTPSLWTPSVAGGTLEILPAWQNGTPGPNSVLRTFIATEAELNHWHFKSGGLIRQNRGGNHLEHGGGAEVEWDLRHVNLSPDADYSSVNVGAYLSLFIALYALEAQEHFHSGLDQWMSHICSVPGYGEVVFNANRSRNPADPRNVVPERGFLGGLWKEQVLDRIGLGFVHTDGTTRSLPLHGAEREEQERDQEE